MLDSSAISMTCQGSGIYRCSWQHVHLGNVQLLWERFLKLMERERWMWFMWYLLELALSCSRVRFCSVAGVLEKSSVVSLSAAAFLKNAEVKCIHNAAPRDTKESKVKYQRCYSMYFPSGHVYRLVSWNFLDFIYHFRFLVWVENSSISSFWL